MNRRTAASPYMLIIPGRFARPVDSLEHASRVYCKVRDDSGEGASTFMDGRVLGDGREYHISYNGKVWNSPGSWEFEKPVLNPYEKTTHGK